MDNERSGKILRVGILSGIATMDPREAADGTTSLVLRQVFEPTVEIVSTFTSPEPRLFSSLDHDASFSRFTGTVREGVVFSDGTPLDAGLMLDSLKKTKVITSRARVETDQEKIVFPLEEAYPKFEMLLSMSHCAIVRHAGTRLVGTGPFMFQEGASTRSLQLEGSLRLVRNPHYDLRVWLDEIVFTVYPPDPDGRPSKLLQAMANDEVDLTINLTSSDTHRLDLTKFHPSIQPGNSTGFLFLNVERLKDSKQRLAIARALDRTRVAEKSFDRNPIAYVARSVLPPMMSRDPELFSYNKREAERLFEEAGRPSKLKMIIPWAPRPYAPNPQPMAEEIASQLNAWDIDVEIVPTNSGEDFFAKAARREFDLAMAGWIADSPDPCDFLVALFHSSSIPQAGTSVSSINLSQYRDPAMDSALSRFRSDSSEENKNAVLELVKENVTVIPLITSQNVVVHSRRVRNFRPSAAGAPLLSKIDLG